MESSSVNGLCRCCASQGAFKDIKTSYHWMGEEEVYSDMLRECFDLNLTLPDQGGICELCITQLRNASNFKKQVEQTEAQFKQHLRIKIFKPAVKEEMSGFDDNDSEDNDVDNVDDEDYVPDYEVPIKTESESEEKPKKRGATKTSSTRTKKSKSSDGDAAVKSQETDTGEKPEPSQEPQNGKTQEPQNGKTTTPEPTKITVVASKMKLQRDVKQILTFSNATPIWQYGLNGYQCVYCEDAFHQPTKLKKHTQEEHDNIKEARFFMLNLSEYIFKLDVTDLKCYCCRQDVDSLESLINHLNIRHKKKIDDNIKDIMLPFKFDSEDLRCALCFRDFTNFTMLHEHMITHCNKKFVCEKCGAGFMWNSALQSHIKEHKDTFFKCRFCLKPFPSAQLRDEHASDCTEEMIVCDYCPERFLTAAAKTAHMAKEHGSGANSFLCNNCNKYFADNHNLGAHIRRVHMMEKNYVCKECGLGFFGSCSLQRHSLTHTGQKDFQCKICSKYFQTRYNLTVHMRTHTNERPFLCEVCNLGFVQKVGLQAHMKSRHGLIATTKKRW